MLGNMSNTTTSMEAQGSVFALMLILDFILGLPGNVVALWLLGFKAPWKPANIYLLNLALADVLLLVGLPFRIDSVIREEWIFHDAFCRLNLFMLSVNQSASIAFMTVLVVDRFFRIVQPLHSICHMSIRCIVILSSVIWAAVLTLRLPLLLNSHMRSSGNSSVSLCSDIYIWTESGVVMKVHTFLFVVEFVIACMLVLFFSVRVFYYLRDKAKLRKHRRVKRTMRLLLTIMIMFAFCFVPSYITGLVSFFLKDFSSCSPYLVVDKMFSIFISFTYLNCALDLILYCLTSACFRDTIKGVANSTGVTHFRMSVKETRSPRRP
ncbi:hydroxycarboxylic acid receptor 2 [Hoplias malabaricus]|uniref:hydroxycarboxylic acid receptor 2 n=1 Tax=Hoplias malabaricus TaxID=27720 RepID=UPI0034623B50